MDKWQSIIKALTDAKYVFISEHKYLPDLQDSIPLHNKGMTSKIYDSIKKY